ncbi:hypothetical protein C9374_005529 [Naegleria lovaniensis]|uniref:non-specific serine/threonine protein kinase n=1 Tax=Naegleria lovaniensis TaxID=51637 RepID=A0AA88GQ45_NAELO|nr:uncharacterized protein C9374_005529 [Naegleria lovaniensis]KAG2382327.1 hypothetical protein C9374_005529 [Naegleria lovaniensis]
MQNYKKVKVVGKGTFGQAVLVQSKIDNNLYIIKQIEISSIPEKERKEALNEVKVLSSLQHPNIVKYVDSFTEGGKLNIVMEYASQGDLYEKIKLQKSTLFPEEKILDWFIQICMAVKYIHDRRILHRDLKTQNIFIAADGTVKLGDFGISKVLQSTMECAKTLVGTPYYLSPELCQEKPYNNKSDVWSLGCILYELTTLKHAFEANNMKALVGKILRGTYPPISATYTAELRNLVAKMLQKDPKDRPSINSVLKVPFIQQRMEFLLAKGESEMSGEKKDSPSISIISDSSNAKPPITPPTALKDNKVFASNTNNNKMPIIVNNNPPPLLAKYNEKDIRVPSSKLPSAAPSKVGNLADHRNLEEKRRKVLLEQREKEKERLLKLQKEKEKRQQEEDQRLKDIAERRREYELKQKQYVEEKLERERRSIYEEARINALRNKMRVKQDEESVYNNKYLNKYLPKDDIPSKENKLKKEEDLKKKEEEKLAQFRKQQYWDIRKQAEANRKRVESQLLEGSDSEKSEAPSVFDEGNKLSLAERQLLAEEKRRKERLLRLRGNVVNNDNYNSGYRSNILINDQHNQFNQHLDEVNMNNAILISMKNVVGDIKKNNSNDDDEIFTSEEQQANSPVPQKFKLMGKTLQLNNAKDNDSLHFRIESLRKFLEEALGDDVLIRVYKLLRRDDVAEGIIECQIQELLGIKHSYLPLVHQLIFCEDILNENQIS